jgi:hypothetical protein
MNPVPATEQVCTYSMSHQDLSLFLSYNNYIGPCLLVCHINLDQDLSSQNFSSPVDYYAQKVNLEPCICI